MKRRMKIISIFLFIWLVCLSTDLFLAQRHQAPVFCVEMTMDEVDGKRYVGLFYQVYHVLVIEEDAVEVDLYVVVPWFYRYDDVVREMEISLLFYLSISIMMISI